MWKAAACAQLLQNCNARFSQRHSTPAASPPPNTYLTRVCWRHRCGHLACRHRPAHQISSVIQVVNSKCYLGVVGPLSPGHWSRLPVVAVQDVRLHVAYAHVLECCPAEEAKPAQSGKYRQKQGHGRGVIGCNSRGVMRLMSSCTLRTCRYSSAAPQKRPPTASTWLQGNHWLQ